MGLRRTLGIKVLEAAVERMRWLYGEGHRVVVSFSAGKDSGVCLEVCRMAAELEGRLPVEAIMRDEEIMLPGTFEYAARAAARTDVRFHWIYAHQPIINVFNRFHPYWWVFDPLLEPHQWVRQPPAHAYRVPEQNIGAMTTPERFPPEPGRTLHAVIGLRVQESTRRRYAVHSSGGYLTKPNKYGVRNCRPIYDWTEGDVWKAIKEHGWDYNCTPHEAPVWMADLSFKPIGDVCSGDKVVGWGTGKSGRARLMEATVEARYHYWAQPLVKVTLASGRTLRCTANHNWLSASAGKNGNWAFRTASPGRYLAHVIDQPPPAVDDWLAGWLGGIYDGEGSYQRIYQQERDNGIYVAIRSALDALGLKYSVLNKRSAAQHGFSLLGGCQGIVDFVGKCRPVKRGQLQKLAFRHRFRQKDRIVSVEDGGTQDVYALTTTTGNYVCWGYASSNSAYDVMYRMSVPARMRRIAPPSMTAQNMDLLRIIGHCWPDWWQRVCARLPGLRTAVRYGKHAVQPIRNRGETWLECFHRVCLGEDVPEWIRERARYVRYRMLSGHQCHSSTPFPEVKACDQCQGGSSLASWKVLAYTMYNGDPFCMKTDSMGLPYMEPEFFRPGAGTWRGKPTW